MRRNKDKEKDLCLYCMDDFCGSDKDEFCIRGQRIKKKVKKEKENATFTER